MICHCGDYNTFLNHVADDDSDTHYIMSSDSILILQVFSQAMEIKSFRQQVSARSERYFVVIEVRPIYF